ncbi:P-loop ATPase [Candidatus Woesearchaeota archaeon]|nr:MAG: P-loop ATPase [Candidatus Woesearchaeota archaeon]
MGIIGITGGKGGTGKSTVATSLAYALSNQGQKVLLVDADVDCPNDHLLLGIELKEIEKVNQRIPEFNPDKCIKCGGCGKVCKTNAIVSIKDKVPIFIKEQCNGCGSCKIICDSDAISFTEKEIGKIFIGKKDGLDFLSGELKPNEPISEFVVNKLNELIEEKKEGYDYIIIDTAAGTHCPVIAALEMCDKIFAVTEPTPLGHHDLQIILELLKMMKKESNIVINRSDIGNAKLIENLSKEYGSKIVAEIPYSKEIVDSYSNAKPIVHREIDKIMGMIR